VTPATRHPRVLADVRRHLRRRAAELAAVVAKLGPSALAAITGKVLCRRHGCKCGKRR
jgi:hypothetical protein